MKDGNDNLLSTKAIVILDWPQGYERLQYRVLLNLSIHSIHQTQWSHELLICKRESMWSDDIERREQDGNSITQNINGHTVRWLILETTYMHVNDKQNPCKTAT
jgi:hypothetical protein